MNKWFKKIKVFVEKEAWVWVCPKCGSTDVFVIPIPGDNKTMCMCNGCLFDEDVDSVRNIKYKEKKEESK